MSRKLQFKVGLNNATWLSDETALTEMLEQTFFRDADANWIIQVVNAGGLLPELIPVHYARMLRIRDGMYARLPGGENFGADADDADQGE